MRRCCRTTFLVPIHLRHLAKVAAMEANLVSVVTRSFALVAVDAHPKPFAIIRATGCFVQTQLATVFVFISKSAFTTAI